MKRRTGSEIMIQIRVDIIVVQVSCLSSNRQFSFLLLDKGVKEENYNNSFERALL